MAISSDKIPAQTHSLRLAAWGLSAALLALPWLAMQFSREVNWTASDFTIFGGMLLMACLLFEVVLRMTRSMAQRLIAAIVIAVVFVLVWAQLAVGII